MDQLIPSLDQLLAPLAVVFRKEVFDLFRRMVAAWIVCLGRHTISRVWETTGQAQRRNHAAAYRLFSQAVWNFDDIARILLVRLLAAFVPGSRVWVVVDDTLCHKRGAKVAFGGIFLDAVLSSRRHKVFRFGTNWVLLGLVVELRDRPDRFFCLPLLWRVYEKQGNKSKAQHRTKPRLAADMIGLLAGWLPGREVLVVADSAYISKGLLHDRPANVEAIGPACWKAALWQAAVGQRPTQGQRLPTPAQLLADDERWPAATRWITFPNGHRRRLHLKQIDDVYWPSVAGDKPVRLVLVRDPKGEWRNEALVSTDPTLPDWMILTGYCRRWSVEQWIKEGKNAVKWTKLSCRRFKDNAARLQLFALAYNLANFLRHLVLPKPIRGWTLTTLREKLVKIGAKVVSHAKYLVFQRAEVSVPRPLFTAIVKRISRLRMACALG